MRNIRDLLQEADPLQHEPTLTSGERDFRRQALLAAASSARVPAGVRSRSRIVVFVTVVLIVIGASFLGSRVRSPFVSDLQAAVRFEVRLGEDKPAPGLREARVSGSDRSVYLHDEVIVNNSDIAAARVVLGGGPSRYSISIEFNASGAEKIRAATGNHIGKPVAILLDGQVVMTPVVWVPIGASAVITGNFTKAEVERIVNGVGLR
jgi:hypothetical protein